MRTLASRDTFYSEKKHVYKEAPTVEKPEEPKTVDAVRK